MREDEEGRGRGAWPRTSARNLSAVRLCCLVLGFGTGFSAARVPSRPAESCCSGPSSPGLSISMPSAPPSPLPPSACRALRIRTFISWSASSSCTRRTSASCAVRRSSVCASSGGLYDVPACGAGTAGNVIAVRGWGASGAYRRGISIREATRTYT